MTQGSVVLPTTGTVSGLQQSQNTNTAIASLITLLAGSSAPTTGGTGLTGLAGIVWHDTTNNLLKIRDQADTTWVTMGGIDETNKIWLDPIGGGTATIASTSTVDLASVPQNSITISGTTTVTSFGTSMSPGQAKFVTFSGILQLTYNATSMILPGAANITTAAGDLAIVLCISSGNYRVLYMPAGGYLTLASAATKSQMQAASSATTLVTPAQTQNHPGVAKAWVRFDGTTGTISSSYNVTSVTRNGAGDYTINFTTPFASASYSANLNAGNGSSAAVFLTYGPIQAAPTASAFRMGLVNFSGTPADTPYVFAEFNGAQ